MNEKIIRKVKKNNTWYFLLDDILFALTNSNKQRKYWERIKIKLIHQEHYRIQDYSITLKGIQYDCVSKEDVLKIMNCIPISKNVILKSSEI